MRRINWFPGMVLTDEHLTLQEQNHWQYAKDLARCLLPYNWGVVQLELDLLSLGQGQLLVKEVVAFQQDGSLLRGRDLKFPCEEGLIFLEPSENSAHIGQVEYFEKVLTLAKQGIFPLLQINNSGEIAKDFLPPCINIKTFSWFKERLENLLYKLKNKVKFLIEKGEYPLLKQILPRIFSNFSGHCLHPFDLYKDLAWLWGCLEIVEEYPPYDHENLGKLFDNIIMGLTEKLTSSGADYERIIIKNVDGIFKVPVVKDGDYIVGIAKADKAWFEQAVVGGEEQFNTLCDHRVLGAKRSRCEFSNRQDLLFWEIEFDKWTLGNSANFLIQNRHFTNPTEIIVYLRDKNQ